MENRSLKVGVIPAPDTLTLINRKDGKAYSFATCKECGKTWNISKLQRVPKSGYICPHCRSKEQRKRRDLRKRITETALKYALIAILGVVLYVHTAEALEIERGYKAYGGELIILLLPIWWIFIEKMARDIVAEAKQMYEEVKANV